MPPPPEPPDGAGVPEATCPPPPPPTAITVSLKIEFDPLVPLAEATPPAPPPPPAITRYSILVTPTGVSHVVVPVVEPDKVKVLTTYDPSTIFSVQVNPPPDTQVLAYYSSWGAIVTVTTYA